MSKHHLLWMPWLALHFVANAWQAAQAVQYLTLSRARCGAACEGVWPYWQVVVLRERHIEQTIAAFVLGKEELQFGPLLLPTAAELAGGGFDGLGFVSHWDLSHHSFDPKCFFLDLTDQVKSEGHLKLDLVSTNEMVLNINGKEESMHSMQVPRGFIVLNQHAEGDAENVVAAFSAEEVRSRLSLWEANCRALHHVPADAEWYCGKKHQLRLHVMAAAVLGPEQKASLPDPSQVEHITRRLEDRGDRRGLQNVSSDGFLGPLQFALTKGLPMQERDETRTPNRMNLSMKLVEDIQDWYLKERTRSAYPGDSIFSGGYFGISSLLSSDVWIMEVPDTLRLPLVDGCRAAIMQWSGLAESDLDPFFAGHHARIYRGGSTCPLHVDRRPGDLETLSCVYHAGSSFLSESAPAQGSSSSGKEQGPYPAWPMDFESHFGRHHQVTFRSPGEFVIYEASITPHGRLTNLMDNVEYVNIFIHFTRRSAARLRPDRIALRPAPHRARYLASSGEKEACESDIGGSPPGPHQSFASPSGPASETGRWEDPDGVIVDEIEPVQALDWQLVGRLPVMGRRILIEFKHNTSFGPLDQLKSLYEEVGITFDRIVSIQPWFRGKELKERTWRIVIFDPNHSDNDDEHTLELQSDNVVAFALDHCRPTDFCALKYESATLRHRDHGWRAILSSPELLAVLDEVVWTYRGSDLQGFHRDIVALREVGIRAHGRYDPA